MASCSSLLLRFSPLSHPKILTPNPHHFSPSIYLPLTRRRLLTPVTVSSSYTATPATDRLVSALSYSLPFFNSLHYGRFLFARVPALAAAVSPVLPFLAAYRAVPFAGFAAFFGLYLGVVRNQAFSRYVRFNSMQAVVLDVLLALPTLAQRVFGVPSRGVGFKIMEVGYDAVFLFAVGCCLYGLVSSILGKTPYLPIVASAADRQL